MSSQPTQSQQTSRRLFIDLSQVVKADARTGIQRVVRGVYLALRDTAPPNVQICPIAADTRASYRMLPIDVLECADAADLKHVPPAQPNCGDMFLGLDLASVIMPRHEATIARWRAAGTTVSVVVYDLLPLRHRAFFRRRTVRHFQRWLRLIRRHSDQLIAISRVVAEDLQAWQRESLDKDRSQKIVPVATMRLAGDISASHPTRGLPADAGQILEWVRSHPTVLMVGTVEPRKAYDIALAAYTRMRSRFGTAAPQLLVVGRPGWKTIWQQRSMRRLARTDKSFKWLDTVTDEFLELLYAEAAGLFLASFAEGFGLPLVEAMSKRRPALVRDIAVFREMGAEGVTFFRDNDPESLAKALFEWCSSAPRSVPNAGAAAITWRESAEDIWGVLGVRRDSWTPRKTSGV